MFTGLIEALGTVHAIHPDGPGRLLQIAEPRIAPELSLGESVAINGVCLTVVECDPDTFRFQVGPETLRLTNLGDLQPQMQVNLERSLQAGARMGGHIVQGHVDGLGRIESRDRQGEWEMIWFSCSPDLAVQIDRKSVV
jgi:riboflavin synthase